MRQLGIPAEAVKQVVVTHAHPDHVMAVPLFREMFPGIRVVASEKAAATMGAEKAIAFFCDVDEMLDQSLQKAGLLGQQAPPGDRLAEKRIAVDRTVKEGDAITSTAPPSRSWKRPATASAA